MKKDERRRRTRMRAFTLLEVLMVVVIIGLLAAFVAPNFFGVETSTQNKLAQAAVDSGLGGALKMYRVDMGTYPTDDDGGLRALIKEPEDEELAEKWNGPYLDDEDSLKDPWGNEYVYEYPGEYNENSFDLYSMGKDGQEGTEDDIKNWDEA